MPRSSLLVLCLALAGCAVAPQAPPPPQVQAPPPTPQQALPFEAQLAALPVRPAGAVLATASQEHALVRQRPALQPAEAIPAPSVTAGKPLAVRVLAVQAAYRRWCSGEALPGDGPLLAEAGGVRLPGAIACQSPPLGLPRRLVPTEG